VSDLDSVTTARITQPIGRWATALLDMRAGLCARTAVPTCYPGVTPGLNFEDGWC
jgi:hypothetical protein